MSTLCAAFQETAAARPDAIALQDSDGLQLCLETNCRRSSIDIPTTSKRKHYWLFIPSAVAAKDFAAISNDSRRTDGV